MQFRTLPNGMAEGFAVLKKCDVKTAKNGSKYLDLILSDKTGEMPAKLWNAQTGAGLSADMVVKVRGTVEQYNGHDQFRIAQIRAASESDNYDLVSLVPASETGGEVLYAMLVRKVGAFADEDLKKIVLYILENHKDRLLTCPAALRLHHAIVGGLLLHTSAIVQMAECVCKIYKNIDRELLLSGAILHDVAKVWELEPSQTGLARGYTPEGELIGHLVKGAMYVQEAAEKLGADAQKATLLEHMILSHHGVPEFGSPVRPMFLEAIVLSSLDNLDANIYEVSSAVSKVEPGAFTDRMWALDNRKLYNHGRNNKNYHVDFGEEV